MQVYMDLTDKEHGLAKRHEMGNRKPGYVADMTGENSNETWVKVVSRRKLKGKTNQQERKRDLQTTESIGIEKVNK